MMTDETMSTDDTNVFFLFYLINKHMYIILKRYKGCLLAFARCSYTE
jgi:hypothetical protein